MSEQDVIQDRLDSQAKRVQEQKEAQQRQKTYFDELRVAVQAMAENPSGVKVLRHLARCQIGTSLTFITGGVSAEGTIGNEYRRLQYLELRALMRPKDIIAVEIERGEG